MSQLSVVPLSKVRLPAAPTLREQNLVHGDGCFAYFRGCTAYYSYDLAKVDSVVTTDASNIMNIAICGGNAWKHGPSPASAAAVSTIAVLAVATSSGIHVWDASASMRFIHTLEIKGGCRSIAWVPSNGRAPGSIVLAVGSMEDSSIHFLHVTSSSLKLISTVLNPGVRGSSVCMASSPFTNSFVSCDISGSITFWSLPSGADSDISAGNPGSFAVAHTTTFTEDAPTCVCCISGSLSKETEPANVSSSSAGPFASWPLWACGFASGKVVIFDARGMEVCEIGAHVRGVTGIDYCSFTNGSGMHGGMLGTVSEDSVLQIFGIPSPQMLANSMPITLIGSTKIIDSILTGVGFPHSSAVCVVAYDSVSLQVMSLE
ncbi:mitochondrial WD40 domain-containing protein [Andalucia godoyi]|uniref:Mitochondrial WD40 domain-containing protein n=1 Tax=Andalucia godoyi TaxID=505711 RepID=A0A8K0F0S3_ANDGO|nr:mitochondrial WD40 domain-containing protein [Andalucia godoyi]|eukprot:ANDGO_04009.mRNA.1 mitochondrial WD40 domain-containing protein